MKSDAPLDYAVFQLSPKRSRCELFVSSGGNTEKVASGLVKPFVAHLRVAEEQVASAAELVKLEVGRRKNIVTWFTKGTLERFVRFVSTPEVLELVNTFDAEMSQLEAARRIYSEGAGDLLCGGSGVTAADDSTKNELLRAIDVRLVAVRQNLSTACARAAAAGFNVDTVSELQMFADKFGAHRLNEACSKFISLWENRHDLIGTWKSGPDDQAVRSSYGSDMSIDDDLASPPPIRPHQQEPTMCQHPKAPSFPLHHSFSRESSMVGDDTDKQYNTAAEKEKKEESSTPYQTESTHVSQPARRLSVQDRINLFENKQKEYSGSGGKPVMTKSVELRRMSSDVSSSLASAPAPAPAPAMEKAVLRRWSGASDMSIDLSSEKKDTDTPLCTPSSVLISQTKSDEKKACSSNDIATSCVKSGPKIVPGQDCDNGLKDACFDRSEDGFVCSESSSNLGAGDSDGWKDQMRWKTKSGIRFEDQENSVEKINSLPGCSKNKEDIGFGNEQKLKDSQKGEEHGGAKGRVASETQLAGSKDQCAPQIRSFGNKCDGQVEIPNRKEGFESRDMSVTQSPKATQKTMGDSGPFECGPDSRIREAFAAQYKGIVGNSLSSQHEGRSLEETEKVGKKELSMSLKISRGSASTVKDSVPQRMRFQRQVSAPEQMEKAPVRRDERSSVCGNSRTQVSSKLIKLQESFGTFSTPASEQVQRVRESKGNQELNDGLKMKANELEKLFAEHKLQVLGDQSNSSGRGRSADIQHESAASLSFRKPVADIASPQLFDSYPLTESAASSKTMTKLNTAPLMKRVDSQNHDDVLNKNFAELSVSEGSRGKFYVNYMQKRDAKLKEEWSSNRAEKEARLKAMQDSLERSRAEMKIKFSGSADRDSISCARRRAERLGSFNTRSILKSEQQHLDFGDSDDDEDTLEFLKQKHLQEDRVLDETSPGNGVSRSAQHKKLLFSRSSSSSMPHTSVAPIPRFSTKSSRPSFGGPKMQFDNPLAQSVPNFSDLRKENTKPSAGASKTTHSQVRNYSRSKSTSEQSLIIKEEKSRRSQSLRKISGKPSEFREITPLDSDGDVLMPLKFDEEVLKSVQTKPFLKKGSRTGFVARAIITKQKMSMASEPANDEEENDDLASGRDDFVNTIEDVGGEDSKTMNLEGHNNFDSGERRQSLELEKLVNSGSENGDDIRSFSEVDRALGSEVPTDMSSTFHPVESMQDWPGESPVSWNSRTQHLFSSPHEISDADATLDSLAGSPTSWNSQSLSQIETDAARMRKKWGTAQKPMFGAHSSSNLSRKDMTRGFKRLLKFGRKSRGSESLIDCVSATTSEGEDDIEDGCDPANQSSEHLRKSRMRLSQWQPSDESFNEAELFIEQGPRSFFSLSSFRGKGSDLNPR
ncbi:COP1-interacting protein-related [Forsythia ovata]|uniref:COP1-interacting protein-related n=1 Tax=Forsythia ovata TaxID=205694 RepID=A0ABD1WZM0_9LAMI